MMSRIYIIALLLLLLRPCSVLSSERDDINSTSRPLLALKSNLLYDAAMLVNIEIEIPINQRYSIAASWICPWWRWGNGLLSSRRETLQILYGDLEIKQWISNLNDQSLMLGWYVSLYAGGGLYDYERNGKGYQGESLLAAGIGCGYAHTINRSGSLRMEYGIGVGYMQSKYRYYESTNSIDNQWHAVWQRNGHFEWLGLTRLKASVVWVINRKAMKGGVR